jgi:hypothetical protein
VTGVVDECVMALFGQLVQDLDERRFPLSEVSMENVPGFVM